MVKRLKPTQLRSYQPEVNPYEEMRKGTLINWWEEELTFDERSLLLIDGWKGETEERHKKLREMYNFWKLTKELEDKYGKSEIKTDVLGLGSWNLWQPIEFTDGKIRRIAHIEYRNMAVDLIRFDDGKELFTEEIKDNFKLNKEGKELVSIPPNPKGIGYP